MPLDFYADYYSYIDITPCCSTIPTTKNLSGMTMTCWVRVYTIPWCCYSKIMAFSTGTSSTAARIELSIDPFGYFGCTGQPGDADTAVTVQYTGSSLTTNQYYFLAGICDYSSRLIKIIIYDTITNVWYSASVNPTAVQWVQTQTSNTDSLYAAIAANADGSNEYFDGAIDDARLYGRVLTDAEIKTIAYTFGKDDIVYSLLHKYTLRELQINSVAATSIKDLAQYKYDGSPYGVEYYYKGIVRMH
jgi:hypothetical protein